MLSGNYYNYQILYLNLKRKKKNEKLHYSKTICVLHELWTRYILIENY